VNTPATLIKSHSWPEHYQAFAASLPHHTSLLNHLTTTQKQVSDARTSLLEAKEALNNKRADLVQLWSRGQMLEEMITILDEMYGYDQFLHSST